MSEKKHNMHVTVLDTLAALKVAESNVSSARIFEIPRQLSPSCVHIPETHASGVLCLLSGTSGELQTVRVIASESLCEQLNAEYGASHGWHTALLIHKRFAFLNTDTVYALVYQLKRRVAANSTADHFEIPGGIGPEPQVPEEARSAAELLADEAAALVRELGYNLFAPNPGGKDLQSEIYLCESTEVYAQGKPVKGGFMVFRGAKGRLGTAESLAVALQKELQSSGVLRSEGASIFFEKDHTFTNHALAATAVLGRSSTGFFEWKHPDGLTFGETLRESLARL